MDFTKNDLLKILVPGSNDRLFCNKLNEVLISYDDNSKLSCDDLVRILLASRLSYEDKSDTIWKFHKYVHRVIPSIFNNSISYDKILAHLNITCSIENILRSDYVNNSSHIVKCSHVNNCYYSTRLKYANNVLFSNNITDATNIVLNKKVTPKEFSSIKKGLKFDVDMSNEDRLALVFDPNSTEYVEALKMMNIVDALFDPNILVKGES